MRLPRDLGDLSVTVSFPPRANVITGEKGPDPNWNYDNDKGESFSPACHSLPTRTKGQTT